MRNDVTVVPVLWSRKDKDGLFPIKVRITKNRKSSYVSIGFSVKKSDWSEFKRKVKTTHTYHREINLSIDKIVDEVERRNPNIKLQLNGNISLLKYILSKVEEKRNSNKFFSTKKYRSLYFHLVKFVGKNNDVFFADITKEFTVKFRVYLENNIVSRGDNGEPNINTVVNYLKVLKTIINHAIKEDVYLGINPIPNHLIPQKKKTKKVPLTINQIWKLNNLQPHKEGMTEGMFNALNVFMFSFWSRGLRISDVLQLKYKHLQEGYFSVKMEKTDEVVNIPLTINNVERVIPYVPGIVPQFCWSEKKYFISSPTIETTDNYITKVNYDELFSLYSVYKRVYFRLEELLRDSVQHYNFKESSKSRKHTYFHEDFDYDSKEMFIQFKNSNNIEERLTYEEYMRDREIYLEFCKNYFKNECKKKENRELYVFPFLRGFEHLKGFDKGNKLSAVTALINKNLYKISDRFDLPKFTTHYARHTFTSTSKAMGVDIYDLKNWLGHTSVKNTEIYINTLDEPKDDAHSLKLYDLLNS
jgi:integrase/recombinase XerD